MYSFVIYFCGIWDFFSSRKHLLITLLRLEFDFWFFIVLFIFICIILIVFFYFYFFVSEGSLGLSILVSMIRSYGNDYF